MSPGSWSVTILFLVPSLVLAAVFGVLARKAHLTKNAGAASIGVLAFCYALVALIATVLYSTSQAPNASAVFHYSVPGVIAVLVYLLAFLSLAFKYRPPLLATVVSFVSGLVVLTFAGIPAWLLVGCATGPVCI